MSKRVFWFCCSYCNDCSAVKIQKISEDIELMDVCKLVTVSSWKIPSHHLLYGSEKEVLDADEIRLIDDLDPAGKTLYQVYAQGFIYDPETADPDDVAKAKNKIAGSVVYPYQHAAEIVRCRLDEDIVKVTGAVLKAASE